MRIVHVTWIGDHHAFLRDVQQIGSFLHGVECNERGVGVREGCTEEPKLMVRLDRITSIEELETV